MNKIALFTATPRSATALLIAAATNCPISHAAVQVDGTWYHASETTGKFSEVDLKKMKGRHCAVYVFDGDLKTWLETMKGAEYDWKGIFGWCMKLVGLNEFTKGNPRKFYCFEAALGALIASGEGDAAKSLILSTLFNRPISGCDIANQFQLSIGFGKFERFA